MEHPIQGLMATAMQNIKEMIDVNTIIGEPIVTADGTIIPVSKVSFGFASGGSDFATSASQEKLFGGGSGAGISIVPVAFLVVSGGQVKLLQISENTSTVDKLIATIPDLVDKIKELLKKDNVADNQ